MNTYWISLPCDLLSSLASFQCSLLHHLHLSSDLGLSKYVNQHSHLNLSRNVRLPVLYDLDFNKPIDFERLRPYFGWVNKHTIEKTFHKTTQWAVASTRYPMRKHFKSRFPAFNIPRQSEDVATDTIFPDTPAIDSGVTMAQIFVGKRTLVTDVYPLKSKNNLSTHQRITSDLGEP